MTPVCRAVGRPDRCSLAVFRQREEPRRSWRVLLSPAFYESPANSARLAGRRPLTSKPVRPLDHTYSIILEGFFNPRLATEALFHGALHLALGGFARDLKPLVVLSLAAGDGEFELYVAVSGVELQGDQGLAVLLALSGETGYLPSVQEELAVAGRVLGYVRGVLVGGDVGADEERLPVPYPHVALLEVRPAGAHGLDLRAGERDAGLVGLLYVEIVEGFPVSREVRHGRFTTLSSARCMSGRISSNSTRTRSPTL